MQCTFEDHDGNVLRVKSVGSTVQFVTEPNWAKVGPDKGLVEIPLDKVPDLILALQGHLAESGVDLLDSPADRRSLPTDVDARDSEGSAPFGLAR